MTTRQEMTVACLFVSGMKNQVPESGTSTVTGADDKRRCIDIALAEFPTLSSRAIAELCGVSNHMVDDNRQLGESPSSTRIGLDGKARPARRQKQEQINQERESKSKSTCSPPAAHRAQQATISHKQGMK
ncbi:MAG: hypothetical protein NTV22_15490 [bacterium]|nr:hypothetical protein [bacterium]